jgi:hypothetical protein
MARANRTVNICGIIDDWLVAQHLAPEEATAEQIRGYLVKMAASGRVSAAYCRCARSALIFLYETVLKQQGRVGDLPRMRLPSQLPVVLSGDRMAAALEERVTTGEERYAKTHQNAYHWIGVVARALVTGDADTVRSYLDGARRADEVLRAKGSGRD